MLPLMVSAGSKDDSKYLLGAVPEVNGNIVFTKGFSIPGRSAQEIHDIIQPWVSKMVDESIPAPGNYARMMHDSRDTITARLCEWMVFKKKALNLDRTRMRYQMQMFIQKEHITISINRIVYNYGTEALTGTIGEEYTAESWISDKEAVNKAGTKLYPKSGKFRRKTVDRMNEIFEDAMDLFEAHQEKVVQQQKSRRHIVED